MMRPVQENLFEEGPPPRLLGSRCRETGQLFYPVQVMNPVTHREGTMEQVALPSTGVLLNFSRIARAAPGLPSPFAIGVIALDGGPTLTAQLTDWQDVELRVGMPVEMTLGCVRTEPDGTSLIGPQYRPVGGNRT